MTMGHAMTWTLACHSMGRHRLRNGVLKRSCLHLPGVIWHNCVVAPPQKARHCTTGCGREGQVRGDKREGHQMFGLLQLPLMVSDALGCNHT